MELNLIDSRNDVDLGQQYFEVLDTEIRNSDSSHFACSDTVP